MKALRIATYLFLLFSFLGACSPYTQLGNRSELRSQIREVECPVPKTNVAQLYEKITELQQEKILPFLDTEKERAEKRIELFSKGTGLEIFDQYEIDYILQLQKTVLLEQKACLLEASRLRMEEKQRLEEELRQKKKDHDIRNKT